MDCPSNKVAVVERWPLVEVGLYFKFYNAHLIKWKNLAEQNLCIAR